MTKSATAAVTASNGRTKSTAMPKGRGSPTKTKPSKSTKPVAQMPSAAVAPVRHVSKPASKQDQLAALLVRDEGATLDQMVAATGWLPHTTRAALTGPKKKGYAISSDKIDGLRTYRAVAP